MYQETPERFAEYQKELIEATCTSLASLRATSIHDSLKTNDDASHQDDNGPEGQTVEENEDTRKHGDRIEKAAKGGDLRPLIAELVHKYYSQGTGDAMELIEDCHFIACGGPLQPFSYQQDEFLRLCEEMNEIRTMPEEIRKKRLDDLVKGLCDGLASQELEKNEKSKDAAEAIGKVYQYTKFFQPPCSDDKHQLYLWFDYQPPTE